MSAFDQVFLLGMYIILPFLLYALPISLPLENAGMKGKLNGFEKIGLKYFFILSITTLFQIFLCINLSEGKAYIHFLTEYFSGNYWWIPLATVTSILFFVMDFFFANLFINKIILLDINYYFTGKVRFKTNLISTVIVVVEELFWRLNFFYITSAADISFSIYIFICLLFGITHYSYGIYNIFSKTALAAICMLLLFVSHHFLVPIVFHSVYNLFVLKKYRMEETG